MAQKKKYNKISIYLIKKGIDYEKILKTNVYENVMPGVGKSNTYYIPTKANRPSWLVNYFNNKEVLNINNSRAQVISLHKIIVDNEERIFAVPFGTGKHLLNDDVIEEQFGLKVLLNSIDKNSFRTINMSNYGSDHRTKNEQMPKKTDISEFGFDVHKDFLRKASAKCEEERFNNKVITGGDLLSVSAPVTIDTIDDFLEFCYRRYICDKYKEKFPWLDNIKEVKEKSTKERLNEKLIDEINKQNFDKIWMAVPEVLDWEKVSDFRFSKTKPGEDDIELSSFLNLFDDNKIPSFKKLESKSVYAMQQDSEHPLETWKAYKCLVGEIELNNEVYCLNYGKWYKVNGSFVDEINNYYNEIPISMINFPCSSNEREDAYNIRLKNSLNDSYLLDKKLVKTKGMGKSSIEVCDVLTKDNELIHVKKNGGSSYLSHLFNQAAVSGEFLFDKTFRDNANEKMGEIIFNDDFNASNYTIVIAIITKNDCDRPMIPFFSKVSIQYAIDGLKRKGYKVEIKNIAIE